MQSKSTESTQHRCLLFIEQLEHRHLLSVVTVMASGDMGGEFFEIEIAGETAGVFRTTQDFTEYRVDTEATPTADQVKIIFTGDIYDPANDVDRNLNVDFITIDGRKFETEAANTFGNGVWDSVAGFTAEGFFKTEKLATNGYFEFGNYASAIYDSTIIEIDASSAGGDGEIIELQIRGEAVASYILSDSPFTSGFDGPTHFVYEAEGIVTADDVRIAFNNDAVFQMNLKGIVTTVDRNLTVDSITVAGRKYHTDSESVFSVGTWDPDSNGSASGFGLGNTLHSNGFFQFSSNTRDSVIVVDTSTAQGSGERYDLQVGGKTVAQTVLRDNPFQVGYQGETELRYRASEEIRPSDIRLVFTNDDVFEQNLSGQVTTVDRNLTIKSISIDDVIYATDDDFVYSTGVWEPEIRAPRPGFGRGDTLHVNGYFEFG